MFVPSSFSFYPILNKARKDSSLDSRFMGGADTMAYH
jgi:hypothetical protein